MMECSYGELVFFEISHLVLLLWGSVVVRDFDGVLPSGSQYWLIVGLVYSSFHLNLVCHWGLP